MTHAAVRTRIVTPRRNTPRMLSAGGRLEGAGEVPRGEGSSVAMGISLGALQAAGKWMTVHRDYITGADRQLASGGYCSLIPASRVQGHTRASPIESEFDPIASIGQATSPVARQGPSRLARLCR